MPPLPDCCQASPSLWVLPPPPTSRGPLAGHFPPRARRTQGACPTCLAPWHPLPPHPRDEARVSRGSKGSPWDPVSPAEPCGVPNTPGQGDPSDCSSSRSRVTMWWQTRPRRRRQPAPGAGSSWCRHGNRATRRRSGPGLFTLPFWQASSATLKPIHGGGGRALPLPPNARGPLRPALPPLALPPLPLLPSHPPLGCLCQSAGKERLGQGRTRIFNSKQISPPQAASPFMHFFSLLS